MTPKEKAEELIDKYLDITLNAESDDDINKYTAKQCALIAVEELILNSFPGVIKYHWEEVKQEIEKL
jgi:hypothetical protein